MTQYLQFALLGLGQGALYAALALTLVITYRSSGVLNFATGAMAAFAAFQYSSLRGGYLLDPLPFLPEKFDLGTDLGFAPAAAITLVLSALLGLLLYVAVFRPLRGATPVAKAVASVGVMVVLNGVITIRFGTVPLATDHVLPQGSVKVGSGQVREDLLWFAAIIVAIALLLAAVFQFTRFGLLTRAAASSEKGAYVSGIQPDRIAAANWVIGAVVAGISGILICALLTVSAGQYTLLVVPALAAAVLGQFERMLPAVIGGLALGSVCAMSDHLSSSFTWMGNSQGARYSAISLALILIVLVVWAKPLPTRGVQTRSSLGRAPRPQWILRNTLIWTPLGVLGLFLVTGIYRDALVASYILGIVSLSLVLVTGYAGQVSLAQLSIAGIAGFALTHITTDWSVPFPIAPLLAALFATVVGVAVGAPALRIRGLPVAVVTLATAVAVESVWFQNTDVVGTTSKPVTGPKLFGIDLRPIVDTSFGRWQFGVLCLVVLVGVALFVALLRNSVLGSQMLAVRANEKSAAGAGINVVRVKIIAFAMASFIAGLGGTLIAYHEGGQGLEAAPYLALTGLGVFTGVYLAGIYSVSGGIMAGILAGSGIVAVLSAKISLGSWFVVISGIGLILTVITNPEGIVGPFHVKLADRRRGATPAQAAAVPSDAHLVAQPPVQGGDVVLAATDVTVRYGGVVAVDNVTLEARKGTIVGLIGPNGAGKTTLLDAISGFAPAKGTVVVEGKNVTSLVPFRRVRAGLGRTFQHAELYDDLSVEENVVVGAAAATGEREAKDVSEVLQLLDLQEVAERPVSELSQGRRQLVSIARALVGNPDVLLLDEPAGGLDSRESQWLGLRLRAIRDSGVTIVIIDHDMHLVLNLCDSIYVLNFGKIIATGPASSIRTDPAVTEAYLGSTHAEQEVSQ